MENDDESGINETFNEIWIQQLNDLPDPEYGISLIELASAASNLSKVCYHLTGIINSTLHGEDDQFPDELYNIFKAMQLLAIEFNENIDDLSWDITEEYDEGNDED